jgi:protein gp37
MGDKTAIQWTDHTFNPWIGCAKVSAGCTHCYAEELMDKRYGRVHWGKGQPRDRTSAENWKLPLRWNADALKANRFDRVFCASLADWLDEEVDANWLADLLGLIGRTQNLHWQLLTKRPENWESRMGIVQGLFHQPSTEAAIAKGWLAGTPLRNAWIGVSAEDQGNYALRIPRMFKIPAKTYFVSAEPLLGPIKLEGYRRPDWLIIGGESGDKARECRVEWISDLLRQCRQLGIAPFVKQIGSYHSWPFGTDQSATLLKLKDKKGGDPSEWPEELRVREFPKS